LGLSNKKERIGGDEWNKRDTNAPEKPGNWWGYEEHE